MSIAEAATLGDFLDALNKAAGLKEGDVLSLIIRGKRCNPTEHRSSPLDTLGVKDGAAVMLVIRSAEERAKLAAQEERMGKLREVEQAAHPAGRRGDSVLAATDEEVVESVAIVVPNDKASLEAAQPRTKHGACQQRVIVMLW